MGDAGAELAASAQSGGVPLEGGLEGVYAPLLTGAKAFVELPAHAFQQLETFVSLVDLYLIQTEAERTRLMVEGERE